jgi:hypothetical protein
MFCLKEYQGFFLIPNFPLTYVFHALALKINIYLKGVGHIRPTPYGIGLKALDRRDGKNINLR